MKLFLSLLLTFAGVIIILQANGFFKNGQPQTIAQELIEMESHIGTMDSHGHFIQSSNLSFMIVEKDVEYFANYIKASNEVELIFACDEGLQTMFIDNSSKQIQSAYVRTIVDGKDQIVESKDLGDDFTREIKLLKNSPFSDWVKK